MESQRYFLLGGPRDGQSIVLDKGLPIIRIPVLAPFNPSLWGQASTKEIMGTIVDYYPFQLVSGKGEWVLIYVCPPLPNDDFQILDRMRPVLTTLDELDLELGPNRLFLAQLLSDEWKQVQDKLHRLAVKWFGDEIVETED